MKKLFGEYLVEKKFITAEDLLSSVVEQTSKLPAIIEVLFRSKALSNEDMLRVVRVQADKKIEFKLACMELGLWSEAIEEKVEKELRNLRIPVGQILIEKGKIDCKTLIDNLDEYIHENFDESTESTLDPGEYVYVPKFNNIEAEILTEYTNYFTEEKQVELQDYIEKVKSSSGEEFVTSLTAFFGEIHKIKGIARLVRVNISEKVLSTIEALTVQLKKSNGEEKSEAAGLILGALQIVFDIKDSLIDSGSEETYWSNDISKAQCLKVLSNIELEGKVQAVAA